MPTILDKIPVGFLKAAYHAEMKNHLSSVERIKRLDRAMNILTTDSQYTIDLLKMRPITFKIASPNGEYYVCENERRCTCPDTEVICKHRFVVKLILTCLKMLCVEADRGPMYESSLRTNEENTV